MTGRAAQKAESVALVVLDVDGVMTDGTLVYRGATEPESKAFNIKDGLGIKLLQRAGIEVAIITGRSSEAVERRATELGISTVIQGREDKGAALAELLELRKQSAASVAYMGDDLPDLGALRLAIKDSVDWVAPLPGGHGAVRALCDFILQAHGVLADLQSDFQ